MPATPIYALRYPAAADPADVPLDMQELATDVESAISAKSPGAQIAYVQITATLTVTATSAAAAQTVVSSGAVTYDGSQILLEFYAHVLSTPAAAGASLILNLFDGAVDLGRMAQLTTPASALLNMPGYVRQVLTPTVGSHTYMIKAWVTTGTGYVQAGAGGTDTGRPAYLRIIRG